MYLTDDGKIRAFDEWGKVADFNYVTWEIVADLQVGVTITDPSCGTFSSPGIGLYDPASKCLNAVKDDKNILINVETLAITNMPTNLPVGLGKTVRYNGYYYSPRLSIGTGENKNYGTTSIDKYNLSGNLVTYASGYLMSGNTDGKLTIDGINYNNNSMWVNTKKPNVFSLNPFQISGYISNSYVYSFNTVVYMSGSYCTGIQGGKYVKTASNGSTNIHYAYQ